MSIKVIAKFRATSCEPQRNQPWERNEKGEYQAGKPSPASRVKLGAVQGEPFGKYTPSGNIDMSVLNGAAASEFQDAWDQFVRDESPEAKAPEWYVIFVRDEGQPMPTGVE